MTIFFSLQWAFFSRSNSWVFAYANKRQEETGMGWSLSLSFTHTRTHTLLLGYAIEIEPSWTLNLREQGIEEVL